jgi:8-oxo-dGTP diphosphatase
MENILIACAIVRKNSAFLVLKRSENQRMPGIWEFPAGMVEDGEKTEEALQRELEEEAGLKGRDIDFLGVNERFDGDKRKVVFGYVVNSFVGEVKLSDEHTEYKWLRAREILKSKTGTDTRYFTQNFLAGWGGLARFKSKSVSD